jgi:hypothetical protein
MSAEELAGRVKQFTRRSAQPRVKITKKTRPQAKPTSKPVTLQTVAQKTKFPKQPKLVFTSKKEVRDFKEKRKSEKRPRVETKNAERLRAAQEFNRSQIKGTGQPDFVKDLKRGGTEKEIPRKVTEKRGLIKKQRVRKLSSEFAENKRKKLLTTKKTQRTSQRTTSIRKQKRRPRVNGDFTQPNKTQDEINQIFDFRQKRSFF